MGGACSTHGDRREVYRVLVGGGKRPLGRHRLRWRIILRWVFRKWDVEAWTGSSWQATGLP